MNAILSVSRNRNDNCRLKANCNRTFNADGVRLFNLNREFNV
jgi:hypothetical protein